MDANVEIYRARLADALAAAEREPLDQARRKHLIAAAAWQTLIDGDIQRMRENLNSDIVKNSSTG